jgi:hypothetical protein
VLGGPWGRCAASSYRRDLQHPEDEVVVAELILRFASGVLTLAPALFHVPAGGDCAWPCHTMIELSELCDSTDAYLVCAVVRRRGSLPCGRRAPHHRLGTVLSSLRPAEGGLGSRHQFAIQMGS